MLFYWKGKSSEKPILLSEPSGRSAGGGEWIHAPFPEILRKERYGAEGVRYQMLCDGIFPGSGRIVGRGLRTTHLMSIWQVPVRKSGVGTVHRKIVAELQRRGIELFLVCDEGGGIITEPIGGIHGNFAMVGRI